MKIKKAKQVARKPFIKHSIFLVSLFASIGMLLFSHYAYAEGTERGFGARIITNTVPPIQCQGGSGPFIQESVGSTYQPTGLTSTNAGSRLITGKGIRPNSWVLGWYSTIPATHCYIQMGPYRYTVETTVFTRYGTN